MMSNRDKSLDHLLNDVSRKICFYQIFVRLTGSTHAALLLSQGYFWTTTKLSEGGWFYKCRADWEKETGLTRRMQEAARGNLRSCGFWFEEERGYPKKLFFRVDLEILANAVREHADTVGRKRTHCKSGGNVPTDGAETSQLIGRDRTHSPLGAKNTSEITSNNPLPPKGGMGESTNQFSIDFSDSETKNKPPKLSAPDLFEELWALWPEKIDKDKARGHYRKTIPHECSHDHLMKCARHYLADCAARNRKTKHLSSFIGSARSGRPFKDFQEPKPLPACTTGRHEDFTKPY